jgi:nitroimidazol reductase NimA-like FMN-containing flavoprotein (pyridoxamine 5'-phosphate oxidase superfamily)
VVVHETLTDLDALQDLLDRSYAAAGRHLLSIITPERRLDAKQVADRLTGMCLLALATATADGRPIIGPVDGIFFRGAFHFGSSPDSVRFRHIRNRPHVSATHMPREEFAVTVHGRAVLLDIHSEAAAEFRQALLEIYLPRYGPQWEDFLNSGPLYARIDADRMFTFCMAPGAD